MVQERADNVSQITLSEFRRLTVKRRTVRPKRLGQPGPTTAELGLLMEAAAAAPDHGELVPWRFVAVPEVRRQALADAFELALIGRDSSATSNQLEMAGEKALRSLVVVAAIARLAVDGDAIPDVERMVSLGCALQNILLVATAMGYGYALTSGKAMSCGAMRQLFTLASNEICVCFVNIGSTSQTCLLERARFQIHSYLGSESDEGKLLRDLRSS